MAEWCCGDVQKAFLVLILIFLFCFYLSFLCSLSFFDFFFSFLIFIFFYFFLSFFALHHPFFPFSRGVSSPRVLSERLYRMAQKPKGKLPTYFVSHGGGPWPWISTMENSYALMKKSLQDLGAQHPTPRAVLMVSAHWEERDLTVMTSPNPPMLYDYFGFPKNTYDVVYSAPGAPDVAKEAVELLEKAGIKTTLNGERGFDHGNFVPMAVMYPEANVPLFQVSILRSYDPAAHLAIGRALADLRERDILIIGSGLSFHNMRMFNPSGKAPSEKFDAWLDKALSLPPDQRTAAINNWETAPSGRVCHEREDHLVPLFVALGAAEGEAATRIYHESDVMGGVTVSSYRFG